MARIAGVTLPNDKRIEIALTYIYGVGINLSHSILAGAKIDGNIRVKDLKENQLSAIREQIENKKLRVNFMITTPSSEPTLPTELASSAADSPPAEQPTPEKKSPMVRSRRRKV